MKFFIDDTKPYQDDKFFNEIRNFINEGNFVGNDACPHNNNLKNVLESNFKSTFIVSAFTIQFIRPKSRQFLINFFNTLVNSSGLQLIIGNPG